MPDPGGATSCFGPIIAKTDFHLKKDDDEVSLTITKDSIKADPSDDSDTISAKATLGDDNTKPRRDRDTFSFQGTEGDTIFVTLENDPEAGHVGDEATLILKDGVSTIETGTGALTIEIRAVLPSSDEYNLIVQHKGISEDVRFRGSYFLSIYSASGEVQEIKPTVDVEQ